MAYTSCTPQGHTLSHTHFYCLNPLRIPMWRGEGSGCTSFWTSRGLLSRSATSSVSRSSATFFHSSIFCWAALNSGLSTTFGALATTSNASSRCFLASLISSLVADRSASAMLSGTLCPKSHCASFSGQRHCDNTWPRFYRT